MKLRVLDLFAGIGGFSLGLEKTGGFETVAFCEIEPFCQKVLAKNWPSVPIYSDVRSLNAQRLRADGINVDVITGGFPCQDISNAGKGAGLEGERSGLWFEFYRLIKEVQPEYTIIENVSALRSKGLDEILRSLSEVGYDAEWHCIPASAIGAPHRRDRVWIVGYPSSKRQYQLFNERCAEGSRTPASSREIHVSDTGSFGDVAHTISLGTQIPTEGQLPAEQMLRGESSTWRTTVGSFWSVEPSVGRVADGIPDRSHRLKALGNAVVPQIPELIGHAILKQR